MMLPRNSDTPKDLVQVIIRTKEEERELWKTTAASVNLSMAEWIRTICNAEVDKINESKVCSHPIEFRESYPWQETCLNCGVRLRDNG